MTQANRLPFIECVSKRMPCGVFAIFTVVIGVFAEAAEAPSTDLSRDAVAREITEILDRTDLILSTTGKSGAEYFDLLVKYKGRFEELVTGDGDWRCTDVSETVGPHC